jgi:parallel beta helix pectate lyase-like protein
MRKITLLFVILATILYAVPAHAQATRTWVSGVGDDANPCSRTSPCKTFAGAISKTAPGGEIDALDPGGFGALTITKAVTIDGGGGQVASVLVSGTNGVVVAAGANDAVILRNLRFNGIGAGINGIRFLSGATLVIENCKIFGFTAAAIDIAPSVGGAVFITESTLTNNLNGVSVDGTGGGAGSIIKISVTETKLASNSGSGILAASLTGQSPIQMVVNQIEAVNNGFGVQAVGPSGIIIGNSTITGNGTGVSQASGASIASYKTNAIDANGVDGTPLTPANLN